jgi:voltage-gated potassium channel
MSEIVRRYVIFGVIPLFLLALGTVGFYFIEEKFTLSDAFYMTVITLTTVGFGEVHPLSEMGRLFTAFLLLFGVFSLAFSVTELVRVVISGELHATFGRQRMARALAGMKDHVIICGYGRMGRHVAQELARQGVSFVVIDRSADFAERFKLSGGLAVVGDATMDEVLKRAGVDRARAVVSVLPHDAENLYVTMSVRMLCSEVFIVARAESEHAERKLLQAGANRVIAPYEIGGFRMAQAVLRPTVMEFIELATRTEQLELQIEQCRLENGSPLLGSTLASSNLGQNLGVVIVAIKKYNGTMIPIPPPDTLLGFGDVLVAMGRREPLQELERLARP